MTVDTLALSKKLKAAGLNAAHAEAIAESFAEAVMTTSATKLDLERLEAALQRAIHDAQTDAKADIAAVRAELRQVAAELRGQIEKNAAALQTLRDDTRASFQAAREDMKELRAGHHELRRVHDRDIRLLLGAITALGLGLAGLMAKGFHWLP